MNYFQSPSVSQPKPAEKPLEKVDQKFSIVRTGVKVQAKLTRGGASGSAGIPKPISCWMRNRLTLRLRATATILAATTRLITVQDVFGAIGVIGRVSNTSVTCLSSAFRLRRCTIYLANSASGTTEGDIVWFSANSDQEPDEEKIAGAQAYQTAGVKLSSQPPKHSTAGFWYRDVMSPINTAVLGIACTTGSLVDLELDFDLPTAIVGSSTISVASASVGAFYRLALNKTNGSSSLVPVQYTTTV